MSMESELDAKEREFAALERSLIEAMGPTAQADPRHDPDKALRLARNPKICKVVPMQLHDHYLRLVLPRVPKRLRVRVAQELDAAIGRLLADARMSKRLRAAAAGKASATADLARAIEAALPEASSTLARKSCRRYARHSVTALSKIIADKLGVSDRTVRRQLALMRLA